MSFPQLSTVMMMVIIMIYIFPVGSYLVSSYFCPVLSCVVHIRVDFMNVLNDDELDRHFFKVRVTDFQNWEKAKRISKSIALKILSPRPL